MLREPSIHITRSQLIKLLKEHIPSKVKIDSLVDDILIDARKYSLSHRSLLATNQKDRNKADKIASSPLEDALLISQTLLQVRRSLKHRGIDTIKPGHRDWNFMKDLAVNANEYLEMVDSDNKKAGYATYLTTAIKKLNKYSLPGLKGVHSRVLEELDAIERLKGNEEEDYTERALKYYNNVIVNHIGVVLTDYEKDPKEMLYFMDVAYLCRELKVKPETYVKAQFEGLSWSGGYPSPSQLATVKGKERLQTYLFANKDEVEEMNSEKNKAKINSFKSLKKLK